MPADTPTILATSGGLVRGTWTDVAFGPLILYAVELSGVTGRTPRLCHVGTAGGPARVPGRVHRCRPRGGGHSVAPEPVLDAEHRRHDGNAAGAGCGLGRRWQRRESARAVAAARPGRKFPQGVDRGRGAERRIRWLHLLAHRWHHGLVRPGSAPSNQWLGLCALLQRGSL